MFGLNLFINIWYKHFFLFSLFVWLFYFSKAETYRISLMSWELVPDLIFFASEFMNNCDDFQILVTRINNTPYFASKVKYRNLNSFLLILLSGDPSLNPGSSYQHKLQWLNECDIFKTRGLYALSISTLIVCCQKLKNFES